MQRVVFKVARSIVLLTILVFLVSCGAIEDFISGSLGAVSRSGSSDGTQNLVSPNKKIAYITSADIGVDPLAILAQIERANTDTYLLSFGKWDANLNISTSDNFAVIPSYNPYELPVLYVAWTQAAFTGRGVDFMLSFGGSDNQDIWGKIGTEDQRTTLANHMASLLTTKFPVYQKNLSPSQLAGVCVQEYWETECDYRKYQLAGFVELAGADFNFQKSTRITETENDNLIKFMVELRARIPMKKFSLTTSGVGADPQTCDTNTVTENCSYISTTRSIHNGEVLTILDRSVQDNLFDFYNVSAFDLGQNYKYDVALSNYTTHVGTKDKIVLGLSIDQQFKDGGTFVESESELINRAKFAKENAYKGIFFWTLGTNSEDLSHIDQVTKMNQGFDAFEGSVVEVNDSENENPDDTNTEPSPPVVSPPTDPDKKSNLTNEKIVYLTAWNVGGGSDPVEIVSQMERLGADTYFLSFGRWDADQNVVVGDKIADIPEYDGYYMLPSYIAWTQFALANEDKDVMLAFGGQTYETMWGQIDTDAKRTKLANNIKSLMNTKFPVYKKNSLPDELVGQCYIQSWETACNYSIYQLVGFVELDGMDFDFERANRITESENDDLFKLVTKLKQLLPNKKFSLTTYHVGADPTTCSDSSVTQDCSYIETKRSSHHGEVRKILQSASNDNLFDFYNVMAYDAGKQFKYEVALANYAQLVGSKEKVVLGLTINNQWVDEPPENKFVESDQNLMARAKHAKDNGYRGIFYWALGENTQSLTLEQQVTKMKRGFDTFDGLTVSEEDPTEVAPDPDTDEHTDAGDVPEEEELYTPYVKPANPTPKSTIKNSKIVYLTSWGFQEKDIAELAKSKADTYFLSFGTWNSDLNILTSDHIASVPEYNAWSLPHQYTVWTQNLLANSSKIDAFVSFGGQAYEAMWQYINTESQREKLANNLAKFLDTKFPVYKKNLSPDELAGECYLQEWENTCNFYNYQLAGYVELAGADFDFEKAARITDLENENMYKFIKRLKELAPHKKFALTTYHVGADPAICSDSSVTQDCSYIETQRSSHHGEVIKLLGDASQDNLFDFYNVMAYDAGKNFKYDVAIANYAKHVGNAKDIVVLGLTINLQWADPQNFVETDANLLTRAKYAKDNGYRGIFYWAIGSNTEQLTVEAQVTKTNQGFDYFQ